MDLDMNLDEFGAAPNGRHNLLKCSLCATTFSALSSWDSKKKEIDNMVHMTVNDDRR